MMNIDIIVASEMRNLIEKGVFKASEKLPSERELCELFNCSRTMLRKSLNTLEKEGWIETIDKKGHFVSMPRYQLKLNAFQSNSSILNSYNVTAQKKLIEFSMMSANVDIALKLDVPLGTDVIFIKRLRIVDNKPVMIESSYILKELCPDLKEEYVIDYSFYEVLAERYGVNVDRSKQTITVEKATKEEARLLDIDENTHIINKKEFVYSDINQLIEYTENIMLIERFELIK